MDRGNIPLNGLRAFEAAARQGSFTRAAIELRVTQAAVSQQIQRLEDLLGVKLFTRGSAGLILSDEGAALFPVLTRCFDEMSSVLDRFQEGRYSETLLVGVVTTYAVGWLLERVARFESEHPGISLRLHTNNNRIDIQKEGVQMAIRFGEGRWPGVISVPLQEAPLTPLCAPALADRLNVPIDLAQLHLFRSYRSDEWEHWFAAAGTTCPDLRGAVFDSSVGMGELVSEGHGVALLPPAMFHRHLKDGRLVQPFSITITTGRYWLTRPSNKRPSLAMRLFEEWLLETIQREMSA